MNLCACGCGVLVQRVWSIGHNRRGVPPSNKIGPVMDASGVGGYVWYYRPEHPRARPNGYVKLCWLVVEKRRGRLLEPGEDVHHINGIKNDDRDENLEVSSHVEHARHHSLQRERKRDGTWV